MAGCDVRSSDSVQPVHSWNWSQMTEGLAPRTAASTKRSAASGPRPTAAAASVQIRTKSRRDTDERLSIIAPSPSSRD